MNLEQFNEARVTLLQSKADAQAKQFLGYMFNYSDVDSGGYDEAKDTEHNSEIEQRNL